VFMDILALHQQGFSMRWISEKLNIHRNTVKRYITEKEPPTYRKQKRHESILAPYHQIIRDWLGQDDFKATWIFDKLNRSFVKQIKEQKARQAYIRFETEPGRQAQMDWADFKILGPDNARRFVYLFIMILGYGRALFAWFVERCTLEAFMDWHIEAFAFFRERFWRGYHFESLDAANRDLRKWLEAVANNRKHSTHGQLILERWKQEKVLLMPLPTRRYDTAIKVYRKVYKDCQVAYGGNRYIVPPKVVGKRILLKI
jgi:hypothetical protein